MFLIVYIVMTVFLALLLYAWAVYPVIVRAVGRKRRPDTAAPTRLHVDIILAAHNEEAHLESRLQNLVDLDRGDLACRVAIHVGLDSCDDASEAIATAFAKNNGSVSVHRFPERRGKVAVLKDLVRATARDDEQGVILFTDANAAFDPGALARLLAPFGDPATGGVCGRLEFTDREGSTVPENFYWRWEKKLKEAESMVDSCLGANGAIYAIRRSLFPMDVPDNTIVDDFVIGMKVREQKHRMVYQSAAVAREEPPAAVEHEWRRRVRIGAGDFQALGLCRKCLSPAYGVFAWMFISHKVLRWFTPHMGMFLVLGSLFLVVGSYGKGVGIVSLAAPLTFLALCLLSVLCAAVGATLRSRPRSPSLFRLCDYFLTMQAALLVGSLRACRGNLKGHWDRTPRTGEMSDAAGQLGQND